MTKIITTIYKSAKHEGMFLYVEREEKFERVPEPLLKSFETTVELMTVVLDENKKLAQANALDVMQAIQDQGFYLQITKQVDPDMQKIAEQNSKL